MGIGTLLRAMTLGSVMIMKAILLAIGIVEVIAQWHLYKKAGEKGWAALIPFYNNYVLVKLTWGNGWLFLLMLIPWGSFIFNIFTYYKLAKAFGKSGGYAVGLLFLPFVFLPILAFGDAEYEGPDENKSSGAIIATGILGGLWLVYVIISSAIRAAVATQPTSRIEISPMFDTLDEDVKEEADDMVDEYLTDYYAKSIYDSLVADNEEYEQIDGYDDYAKVTLDNGVTQIETPILCNDENPAAITGATVSGTMEGVTISVTLDYSESTDAAGKVSALIEEEKETYDFISHETDVTLDDMISGDGFALQQMNYKMTGYDGNTYSCFEIIKCDITEGYPVIVIINVDNSIATEKTASLFEDACELYGIDFDYDE